MTRTDLTEWLPGPHGNNDLEALAAVLHAAVHGGASVGFVLPFSLEDALGFWRDRILPVVRTGARRVWVARVEGRLVGTVQLILDTPPNQRHRAEIAKLLVLPDARRLGIGRALMQAAEAAARGRANPAHARYPHRRSRRTPLPVDGLHRSGSHPGVRARPTLGRTRADHNHV